MRALVLIRNEWLKTTRRRAFWVTLLFFTGILSIMFVEAHLDGVRGEDATAFALPSGWGTIVGEAEVVTGFFLSIILIMLVCSEFGWKTARQNVIDGLSKGQFFGAKLWLLALVWLAFVGALYTIGGGVALYGTDLGAAGALIRGSDVAILGGYALSTLGLASMAFFLAITTRSTGPAMGLFFLYVAFGERLIGWGLSRLDAGLEAVVTFLPFSLFQQAARPIQWDPVRFQQAVERAVEADRTPPEILDPGLVLALTIGYILLFTVAGYPLYRKKDL